MRFRNPETGEVFEDISDALEDAYQCWDCPGIGSCPIGRKAMNYNMDCCSVVEKHAEKAARLMGYEVVEDEPEKTCDSCKHYKGNKVCGFKDFAIQITPEQGCAVWKSKEEANMDKQKLVFSDGMDAMRYEVDQIVPRELMCMCIDCPHYTPIIGGKHEAVD